MKKLRLRALSLGAREILSREQLKSISGGCTSSFDCSPGYVCNAIFECEDTGHTQDPASNDSWGSGSGGGDPTGCPDGYSMCTCSTTHALMGCLTSFDCANLQPC